VYGLYVSSRRARRRIANAKRHAPSSARAGSPPTVLEATRVEHLAYTRTQAAEALGVSRSTFDRRVLPLLETIEMPWGTKLIPVEDLNGLMAEQRRPAQPRLRPAETGRPATLPIELVRRIHAERAAGKSLAQIARDLNASGTATAHGGAQSWPSTVRAVLLRDLDSASGTARPVA
jgi:hypothetical protein